MGVLVLALLLGGAVENGCASLLGFFGAGAWAAALEPYTLFGQFSALAQGEFPKQAPSCLPASWRWHRRQRRWWCSGAANLAAAMGLSLSAAVTEDTFSVTLSS